MGKRHVKRALHSPRQCSWQSRAALEPGSPNKAASRLWIRLCQLVCPVQTDNFPIKPMSLLEGTSDYWVTASKSYAFVYAFLIQVSADHWQTTFTSAGYLFNKLHPCPCGWLCHRKGWGWDKQQGALQVWVSWSCHMHQCRAGVTITATRFPITSPLAIIATLLLQ